MPNNKIFVGEGSYGRTFRMAKDGCWGPMGDCTGTKFQSDATPGRCTNTSGYLAMAEINEIIKTNAGTAQYFYDSGSQSDILLFRGLCLLPSPCRSLAVLTLSGRQGTTSAT